MVVEKSKEKSPDSFLVHFLNVGFLPVSPSLPNPHVATHDYSRFGRECLESVVHRHRACDCEPWRAKKSPSSRHRESIGCSEQSLRSALSSRNNNKRKPNPSVPTMTTLSVVQYNVLAEALSNPVMCPDAGFSSMPPEHMSWAHRGRLVIQKIKDANADLVCLQEVDHYYDSVEPALREVGYLGIYREDEWSPCRGKSDGTLKDGVAIFYKRDTLELVGVHAPCTPREEKAPVEFGKDAGKTLMARFRVFGSDPEVTSGSRHATHVSATEQVIVCTSHFSSAKTTAGASRRVTQAATLMKELEAFRKFSCDDGDDAAPPVAIIFAGDLNATPDEVAIDGIKKMFVSTYETFLGHEPNFTTWKKRTGAFKPGEAKMTIDYIFVSNECETVDVAALPGVEEIGHKALPCPEYPSDHLMLRAVVKLPERG